MAQQTSTGIRLDQYFTRHDVAAYLYEVLKRYFDPNNYQMIEPSAGEGAFFSLLTAGSIGYDLEPRYPGIRKADFLSVDLSVDVGDREAGIFGNPPFGRNSSTAVRFFNHAAAHGARFIALILPRTFRKPSIQNRLDRAYHLLHEEDVRDHAFLFDGQPYDVPTTFQIWERRAEPRELTLMETRHPDFEFTGPDNADFAIQRVGARAGRIHQDFARSKSSHYFIRGDVQTVMAQLDFASVARNTAGNPSLARSEIVRLYREWLQRNAARPSSALRFGTTARAHNQRFRGLRRHGNLTASRF